MMKNKMQTARGVARGNSKRTAPTWANKSRPVLTEGRRRRSSWQTRRLGVTLPAQVWALAETEAERSGVSLGEAVSFVTASLMDFGDLPARR